eukprot:3436745-Pyramimonas_sp.AAC.1
MTMWTREEEEEKAEEEEEEEEDEEDQQEQQKEVGGGRRRAPARPGVNSEGPAASVGLSTGAKASPWPR